MYRDRAEMGPAPQVSDLRTRRLLRFLRRSARQQTLQRDRTSRDASVQVRRLEVVLRRRGVRLILRRLPDWPGSYRGPQATPTLRGLGWLCTGPHVCVLCTSAFVLEAIS